MTKHGLTDNERIDSTIQPGCANCGRPCHEGPLWVEMTDGDNKPIVIKVCDFYRPLTMRKK